MFFPNLHSGLSSVEMDYQSCGVRVLYSVCPLTDDYEPIRCCFMKLLEVSSIVSPCLVSVDSHTMKGRRFPHERARRECFAYLQIETTYSL